MNIFLLKEIWKQLKSNHGGKRDKSQGVTHICTTNNWESEAGG